MAITIDNVEYDETTLDASVKNSIVQVQASSKRNRKVESRNSKSRNSNFNHTVRTSKMVYRLMMMQKHQLKPLM